MTRETINYKCSIQFFKSYVQNPAILTTTDQEFAFEAFSLN